MKKLLFLFVFLPFAAYAKKCDFCKEMASEMCQDKGLKLLGDDECIECCKKGQGYSDVAIKGSPSWWEYQGSYLVPNGKHKCCDGSTFTYISHNPENGKAVNIKQCCNSGSTHACDLLDRGQTISIDGTCFCGCWNDYDCRGLSWQAKYHCSSNHRCMAPEDIDISGIFVQIQDFAGGKITSEKVQRLVEKIRQDFLKSTGNDKLKIVFKAILNLLVSA